MANVTLQSLLFFNCIFSFFYGLMQIGQTLYKLDNNYEDWDRRYVLNTYLIPFFVIMWTSMEPIRLYLGFSGNLRSSIPSITAFLFIVPICILYTLFMALIQPQIWPYDYVFNAFMFLFLVGEMFTAWSELQDIIWNKTARFAVDFDVENLNPETALAKGDDDGGADRPLLGAQRQQEQGGGNVNATAPTMALAAIPALQEQEDNPYGLGAFTLDFPDLHAGMSSAEAAKRVKDRNVRRMELQRQREMEREVLAQQRRQRHAEDRLRWKRHQQRIKMRQQRTELWNDDQDKEAAGLVPREQYELEMQSLRGKED